MSTYCYNCMKPIEAGMTGCPHCGQSTRSEAPPHQLRPGTLLRGRYLIGRALGQGGFGITYIGRDTTLDVRVAIKEYYPNGYSNRNHEVTDTVSITASDTGFYEKGKAQFLREAKTLARFYEEPGIVSVHDFFEENNTAYIVMEYLDGITLKKLVESGKHFSCDELFTVMKPLITALNKVHAQGIIHRDISPDNIILLADKKIKLLDFGAAREVGGDKSLSVMLKPGYAPEEQYRSKGKQGPWTDVYALCATMYFCLTGVKPDESVERAMNPDSKLKRPSELGAVITAAQESVILHGMNVHAAGRYQSMKELHDALCAAEKKSKPKPEPNPKKKPEPKPNPEPKPPRPKWWIAVLLAAVVLTAGAWILLKGNPDSERAGQTTLPAVSETPLPTETLAPEETTAASVPETVEEAKPETVEEAKPETVEEVKPETVEERYLKAAEAGDTAAMSNLGTLYYQGNGVVQDYQQALKWFLEAERGGNTDVQYILGYMYEMGFGTDKDLSQANAWYQKAADNGDTDAAARLAALQAAEKTNGLLTGEWGNTEAIHNGTTAAFYLDEPVYDCRELTMTLRIASYEGYPFGEWYLYLLDMQGNWSHEAKFKIDKNQADGRTIAYELDFESPMSFKALAICPAENGMEFKMGRELLFYIKQKP